MKLLVIEDDAALAKALCGALRAEGWAVDLARDGEDGQHLGETETYDAALVDLGLPKVDGLKVIAAWRGMQRALPVLILTARDDWTSKVEGFKAGADDYLVKPVRIEEVAMRLRALVRRAAGHANPEIVCGPLSFNAQIGTFSFEGLPLKVTALEWRVLSALMLRKGVVVQRADLLERVYEGDAMVDSNSIEVIVARLRKKIGTERIETLRGLGYRLVCDG